MATRIDVVSVFRKNIIRPAKFKYGGRTHRVEKILYNWVTREGSFPVHHFTVVTRDENRYEITLNTYTMEWSIEDVKLNVKAAKGE